MTSAQSSCIPEKTAIRVIGCSQERVDFRSNACSGVWLKLEAAHIQVQMKEACCLAWFSCASWSRACPSARTMIRPVEKR